jgi:hypothetical protein
LCLTVNPVKTQLTAGPDSEVGSYGSLFQGKLGLELRGGSGILPGIDAELFYASKERCAIDTHACGRSISSTDASLTLG